MARSHHKSAVADVSLPATLVHAIPESDSLFSCCSWGRPTAYHRLARLARVAINRVCSDFGLLKLQNTVDLFHWPVSKIDNFNSWVQGQVKTICTYQVIGNFAQKTLECKCVLDEPVLCVTFPLGKPSVSPHARTHVRK